MPKQSFSRFLITTAALATVAVHAPMSRGQSIPTDVAALRQQLFDSSIKQDQRDQAAERLLSRPDPAARQAIRAALEQVGQSNVQFAAAHALASQPTADPQLKNPLFALLTDASSNDQTINAAGSALSAFKGDPDVLVRLMSLAKDSDERVRVAAIKACGTFIDQRVAALLVDLLDPNSQSPRVNAAAADALAYLSGLNAAETSAEGWRNWWKSNSGKSTTQFQADMALARSARFDRVEAASKDLQSEFQRLLTDQYQRLGKDQKSETLIRYFRSPEPTVRVIGCEIVRTAAANAELPTSTIREQLRQLIGDSSVDVRRKSAEALALINDPEALDRLLTQLNQETDPAARAAQINALRPIGDVRAAPLELAMLDDLSPDVVQAAAGALGDRDFGPRLRQQNPALADEAAEKLLKTMQDRTTAHNNLDLRYALVQATVSLQSKSLAHPFMLMLAQPVEQPRIRRELLNALGAMRDPQLADTIASSLYDSDPVVQLAAVKALGKSIDSLGSYDRQLADLIDPNKNYPPEVQSAAWNVLVNLFTKAPTNQLAQWESNPTVKGDPTKLLVLYREERSRARSAGDQDAVAAKNQQIGDACSKAGLWSDAIVAYQDALTYAQQANKGFMVELISEGLANAYLASRQYEQAVNFVQSQIRRDPSIEGTLGPILPNEAEKLVNDRKDFDAATQLMDMTLKMNPGLQARFIQRVRDLQSVVDKHNRERNLTPDPLIDKTQNA